MTLQFLPVDWPRAQALCLAFRCDAWLLSYGSLKGFSENDTLAWFEHMASEHRQSFIHVWAADQVIGQIEYRAPISVPISDASKAQAGPQAYINLLYLVASQRGRGFGQVMHDYVLRDLHTKQCRSAGLRYIPGNTAAQRFYAKNGWQALVPADAKGQLLTLDLT